MRVVVVVGLVGSVATAQPATADEATATAPTAPKPALPSPRWQVAPIVGTDFPLDIFVGVEAEAPFRLRISSTLGVLPGAYVDVINKFLVGIGAYNQSDADLIRSSLKNSVVWRTHIGHRPWRRRGFYGMVGYGLVSFGGGATGSEIITAASGKELPATDQGAKRSLSVSSTLHMLDVELGWAWGVRKHWTFRTALGAIFTVAASTTITPDYMPVAPRLTQEFADQGAAYLDNLYTSYVISPVITATARYSF